MMDGGSVLVRESGMVYTTNDRVTPKWCSSSFVMCTIPDGVEHFWNGPLIVAKKCMMYRTKHKKSSEY